MIVLFADASAATLPRSESLSAVKEWLKQLPSQGQEAVDCGSYTLDAPQIAAMEKAVFDVQVREILKCICMFGYHVKMD